MTLSRYEIPREVVQTFDLAQARGWALFPVHAVVDGWCTCGLKADSEHTSAGKHPRTRDGFKSASLDRAQWESWYAGYDGELSWALATGSASGGVLVVDVDGRHDGYASLARLREEVGGLPHTLQARSGSGSPHYYFQLPDGVTVQSDNRFRPGIDIKSDGGYVVLPPAKHASGGTYAWEEPLLDVAEAPAALLQTLAKRHALATAGEFVPGAIFGIPDSDLLGGVDEGFRDEYIFKSCCRWFGAHKGDRAAVEVLAMAMAANSNPPFLDWKAKVDSAEKTWRRGEADAVITGPVLEVSRLLPAGDFVLDQPDVIPAIWGENERVLWAEGEGLMIAGHQGVGKTTIAQQLVLHMTGLRDGPLLGLQVKQISGSVLYLAMDRPRQAARSMRRMINPDQRGELNARVSIWRGPLPINPLKASNELADFIKEIAPDCQVVVIDSVKDLAPGISKDEIGAGLNMAWQELIARDIQLLLLHHERKAGQENKRHHSLDDIYGSTWLTSGLGSVITFDGEPGDPAVELKHLKQPADVVGPLKVQHDHPSGTSTLINAGADLRTLLLASGEVGVTLDQAAYAVIGKATEATKRTVKKDLLRLEEQTFALKVSGVHTPEGRQPDRWRATGLMLGS